VIVAWSWRLISWWTFNHGFQNHHPERLAGSLDRLVRNDKGTHRPLPGEKAWWVLDIFYHQGGVSSCKNQGHENEKKEVTGRFIQSFLGGLLLKFRKWISLKRRPF
jgi:hypothetical protein